MKINTNSEMLGEKTTLIFFPYLFFLLYFRNLEKLSNKNMWRKRKGGKSPMHFHFQTWKSLDPHDYLFAQIPVVLLRL